MEPMIEAFTTVVRPADRAKMVMMSSAALPNVALRIPPMRRPAWPARLSVAWPRTQARPIRASAVIAKIKRVGACSSSTATTATVSAAVRAKDGDDDLRRVADGGVENPAEAGAGVPGEALGCLPEHPGGAYQGERRDREDQERRRVHQLHRHDRDRERRRNTVGDPSQ